MLVGRFFWNHKDENYKEIYAKLLNRHHGRGVNMSLKYILLIHLYFVSKKLGARNDVHRERFCRYLEIDFCDENMLGCTVDLTKNIIKTRLRSVITRYHFFIIIRKISFKLHMADF